MQGQVEAVGEVKSGKFGPHFTAKIGGTWYSISAGDDVRQKIVNKNVSFTVSKPASGNFYAWIKLDFIPDDTPKAAAAPSSNGNGHGISWHDYAVMSKLAHGLALELEPDGLTNKVMELASGTVPVMIADRSTARAAIMNTVMIAFSNGKIVLDDDVPF